MIEYGEDNMKTSLLKFVRAVIIAILFFVIDCGINYLYEKITGQICRMGVSQLIIGFISLFLTFLCDKGIERVL